MGLLSLTIIVVLSAATWAIPTAAIASGGRSAETTATVYYNGVRKRSSQISPHPQMLMLPLSGPGGEVVILMLLQSGGVVDAIQHTGSQVNVTLTSL